MPCRILRFVCRMMRDIFMVWGCSLAIGVRRANALQQRHKEAGVPLQPIAACDSLKDEDC